jgi:hypothetical protein
MDYIPVQFLFFMQQYTQDFLSDSFNTTWQLITLCRNEDFDINEMAVPFAFARMSPIERLPFTRRAGILLEEK